MSTFFPPQDASGALQAILQLLDADAQILLLINRQLLVVEQTHAAECLLDRSTFYSLEDYFSSELCRALKQVIENNCAQQFLDHLDAQPVTIRVLPFPPGALLALSLADHTSPAVLQQLSRHTDHIMREKLNLILAAISALRQQPPSDEKLCRYLAMIARNAMSLLRESCHLEYLLQSLEQWQTQREPTDLTHLFVSLQQTLASSLAPAQFEQMIWRLPSMPLIACCDAEQISLALLNLIDNSFEHNPPNIHLTVRLQLINRQVLITVSDDGCGIPPNVLNELPSLNQLPVINGQTGLALANRIMANHFGAAFFSSSSEAGASVTLSFPSDLPYHATFDSPSQFQSSPQFLVDRELSSFLSAVHYFPVQPHKP